MQPEPPEGLSPAALDVRHALEDAARQYPEASAPALVLMLARRFCPVRLKRRDRRATAGAYVVVLGACFGPVLMAAVAGVALWLAGVR